MKRSQHTNHAVMEIRENSAISYAPTEYLYTWRYTERRMRVRIKEIVNTEILYRVHCNLEI